MNKGKYLLLGALPLLLASCSEEVNTPMPPAEGNFHLTVKLSDDFRTRADDELPVDVLLYAIYDADNNDSFVSQGQTGFDNNSVELGLSLTTSKSYKVALFATSSAAVNGDKPVYVFNGATTTLNVNYANMTSTGFIDNSYDCFYNTKEIDNVGTTTSASVTLQRPVGQINWGTNDLAADPSVETFGSNGEYLESRLIVTNPYSSMNLLNGNLGQSSGTVTLPASGIIGGTYPTDDESYTYIACQYLLAPAEAKSMNMTLWVSNAGNEGLTTDLTSYEVELSNVQVQANFQTNIYGELVSGQSGTINRDDWESGTDPFTWDGSTVTYPTIPSTPSEPVAINRASDLAGLAAMVNGTDGQTANDFEGYTIQLNDDFDMNGMEFPMIGSATRDGMDLESGSTSFKGTFDGNNKTISNVVIDNSTAGADDAVGIFASVSGSGTVIKNVTFDKVSIKAPNSRQVGVVGLLSDGAVVSGVNVNSGEIEGKEGTGAIVGRLLANGTVSSCNNSASVTSTGSNTGGIVGAAYYTSTDGSMVIENCHNTGSVTGQSQAIGGVVGLSAAEVSGCSNSGVVTGATTATGGIVGQQNCAGSVKNCENTGDVVGGNGYGAGGIVGWVRYNGTTTDYPVMNIIEVSNNTNSGNISGTSGAGGIVGVWYMSGICNYNSNTASSITASSQWASGIIGGQQWTESGPQGEVSGNTDMLYVEYNYSDTMDSAGEYLGYVYVNSSGNVTQTGNSHTDPNVTEGTEGE